VREAGPDASARTPDGGSAFAPLAIPAYRRVWIALVVSSFGTFLQLAAGPWVMQEMTGSPFMVGLVTTALFLPRLVLTLPFGALADLVDRRLLVVAGQCLSAVAVAAMALLTFIGRLDPLALLALTLILGIGNAVSLPAMQALIPSLVPRHMLAQAVTLQAGAGNVARALGPSVAGALIALGLTHVAFGMNAVSFLAVIAVVLGLDSTRGALPGEDRSLVRSIAAGIRYARFTPPVRRLLTIAGGYFLTTSAVQALLPSLVSDRLGLGAGWYGILFGLFGAGALIGVLSRDRVYAHTPRGLLPLSVTGFGASGLVLGLLPVPAVAAVLLTVCGLFWVWTVTTLNASLQALAPDWVRGRIVSLFLLAWGLQPVGALLAGSLAEVIGVGTTVSTMTAVTLLLGLSVLRWEIPTMEDIDLDQRIATTGMPGNDATSLMPSPPSDWGSARMVVMQKWRVEDGALEEFRAMISELRRERLRIGATRWEVLEEDGHGPVFTELFRVPDARRFDAQQRRPDRQTREVLERLQRISRSEAPDTRYLREVDVSFEREDHATGGRSDR
jgi:MFS family permease